MFIVAFPSQHWCFLVNVFKLIIVFPLFASKLSITLKKDDFLSLKLSVDSGPPRDIGGQHIRLSTLVLG